MDDEKDPDDFDTDDFDDDDYAEFVEREFGAGGAVGHRPIWVITAAVLLAVMAWVLIGRPF